MALTITDFNGCEWGGIEDWRNTSNLFNTFGPYGSARSGSRYIRTTTDSDSARADLYFFDHGIADPSTTGYFACWAIEWNTSLPTSGAKTIATIETSAPAIKLDVKTNTDGTVSVIDSASTTLFTTTATMTAGAWTYFSLYWTNAASNATVTLFMDGNQEGTSSTANTSATQAQRFRFWGNVDQVVKLDDVVLGGAAADSDLDGIPGFEVFRYLHDITTATPDAGTALDVGTWDLVNNYPANVATEAAYTASNVGGEVDMDDATNGGPSGDSNIDGTIVSHRVGAWVKRGGGSTTTHTLYLGNDVDGSSQTTDLALGTGYAWRQFIETANLPTTSQYGRVGFRTFGGNQDIYCADIMYELLHQQPAAGGYLPRTWASSMKNRHRLIR